MVFCWCPKERCKNTNTELRQVRPLIRLDFFLRRAFYSTAKIGLFYYSKTTEKIFLYAATKTAIGILLKVTAKDVHNFRKLIKFLFENLTNIYYKKQLILHGKLWQS